MSATDFSRHQPLFVADKWSASMDEAGRGALAGPLCVAVVAAQEPFAAEVNDSKKLRPHQRQAMFNDLKALQDSGVLAIGVGWVSVSEIDEHRMAWSLCAAIHRAVDALDVPLGQLWIDGPHDLVRDHTGPASSVPRYCEPRLDGSDRLCAAASIVAKTLRDEHMVALNDADGRYGFSQHKGYGTKAHQQALADHGPSAEHRQFFLKSSEPTLF